jgi:hypothetical protein
MNKNVYRVFVCLDFCWLVPCGRMCMAIIEAAHTVS